MSKNLKKKKSWEETMQIGEDASKQREQGTYAERKPARPLPGITDKSQWRKQGGDGR